MRKMYARRLGQTLKLSEPYFQLRGCCAGGAGVPARHVFAAPRADPADDAQHG